MIKLWFHELSGDVTTGITLIRSTQILTQRTVTRQDSDTGQNEIQRARLHVSQMIRSVSERDAHNKSFRSEYDRHIKSKTHWNTDAPRALSNPQPGLTIRLIPFDTIFYNTIWYNTIWLYIIPYDYNFFLYTLIIYA